MTERTAYFPRCQLDTYHFPEFFGGRHVASIDRIEKAKWKAEIVQLTLHEARRSWLRSKLMMLSGINGITSNASL